jgi:Leu/Phe-tRNA-protein transferase
MKGDKLPKSMWVKGKSKNFYTRLTQEGIKFGVNVWNGIMIESPMDKLYKKLNKK